MLTTALFMILGVALIITGKILTFSNPDSSAAWPLMGVGVGLILLVCLVRLTMVCSRARGESVTILPTK